MITDGEIAKVFADETGCNLYDYGIALENFARAIYQLGRQHQRESDADVLLAQDVDPSFKRRLAEAIRNNTGELK